MNVQAARHRPARARRAGGVFRCDDMCGITHLCGAARRPERERGAARDDALGRRGTARRDAARPRRRAVAPAGPAEPVQ